ncbi:MAG TPA: translation initiation factor IF-2, partial [Limnochordales bacterium]
HGKTTLLDAIRETRVAATEAGGITQHIGAYQVEWNGKKITFLDTPGHEAFTAMRSRGAQVTDIAVLVVAADDGVMPQTIEAINHARAADVPIIVALNKIDKPDANPDRVKQQLADQGLIPEEWGGDTVVVPISALRRQGLDELLEMILLVAELRELKANPDRPARGVIIEAELDKGRGPVCTVLVKKGTLRLGDAVVAGHTAGKVRAMLDDRGQPLSEAGPATPVSVLGLDDVPMAGDELVVVADERLARELAARRREEMRQQEMQRPARANLEQLFEQVKAGQLPELNIIIKGDVQGSVEALRGALEKLSRPDVRLNVIHAAVGGITKTDVDLAAAANAIIIGFNVRPDATARKVAEQENVDIRTYRVIYDAIEEMEKALEGMLEPEYREVVLGRAEVRALFRVPNVGTVAGCYVTEGKVVRGASVRVIRDGTVVHEGAMSSLKRFKDDVREVAQGYECGIGLEKFNDLKEGDVLEFFRMEQVARDGR